MSSKARYIMFAEQIHHVAKGDTKGIKGRCAPREWSVESGEWNCGRHRRRQCRAERDSSCLRSKYIMSPQAIRNELRVTPFRMIFYSILIIVAFIGSFAMLLRATFASAIRSAAHFRYDKTRRKR